MTHNGKREHILWVRDGRQKDHPLYNGWAAMLRRCSDPNQDPKGIYFHAGVMVYEPWTRKGPRFGSTQWAEGFINFLDYMESVHGARPVGWTLDRWREQKALQHYLPGCVRWAPPQVQALQRHKFRTRKSTGYKWVTKSVSGKFEGNFKIGAYREYVGTFPTAEEAYKAVCARRLVLGLPIIELNRD